MVQNVAEGAVVRGPSAPGIQCLVVNDADVVFVDPRILSLMFGLNVFWGDC